MAPSGRTEAQAQRKPAAPKTPFNAWEHEWPGLEVAAMPARRRRTRSFALPSAWGVRSRRASLAAIKITSDAGTASGTSTSDCVDAVFAQAPWRARAGRPAHEGPVDEASLVPESAVSTPSEVAEPLMAQPEPPQPPTTPCLEKVHSPSSTQRGTPASSAMNRSLRFADWLEERPYMWRIGASAGMGWEFPLSSAEKRELVMLSLAGETMSLRDQIARQEEIIEMLQECSS